MSIFSTFSNSDTGYLQINKKLQKFKNEKRFYNFKSLSHKNYLSLLKNCDLIIGNSSSGIIEAPSLGVPTVNIGNRQHGRIRSNSIIDCDYNIKNIKISINKGLKLSKKIKTKKIKIINPYDFGNTSNKIISILKMKKTY